MYCKSVHICPIIRFFKLTVRNIFQLKIGLHFSDNYTYTLIEFIKFIISIQICLIIIKTSNTLNPKQLKLNNRKLLIRIFLKQIKVQMLN